MRSIMQFLHDEEGATALEYGLLAALIAAGIVTAVQLLQGSLNTAFTNVANTIGSAAGGGSGS
ncbi:MAG: Flp family type IVb pilin [Nitrospirae bacterium]|nr:MAG: Flp family type IVb pilin [Nitrospirota bacterium]